MRLTYEMSRLIGLLEFKEKMEQLQNKRFQLEFAKARNLQTLIIRHRSRHFLANFCFIANSIDILVNINIYKIELLLFLFLGIGLLLNVTEKKKQYVQRRPLCHSIISQWASIDYCIGRIRTKGSANSSNTHT